MCVCNNTGVFVPLTIRGNVGSVVPNRAQHRQPNGSQPGRMCVMSHCYVFAYIHTRLQLGHVTGNWKFNSSLSFITLIGTRALLVGLCLNEFKYDLNYTTKIGMKRYVDVNWLAMFINPCLSNHIIIFGLGGMDNIDINIATIHMTTADDR